MKKQTAPRRGSTPRVCHASPEQLRAKQFDKYYTKSEVARRCFDLMMPFIGPDTLLIEPSAGAGAFLDQIDRDIIGLDIAPDNDNIIERDFLTLPTTRQHDVAFIGNPPFGPNGRLAIDFINHALAIGGTVGFILPITFRKWMRQTKLNPAARLVLDHQLPAQSFTKCGEPCDVRSVFQIWTTEGDQPDLRLIEKPSSAHADFNMTRIGTGEATRAENAEWDFAVPRTGGYDFTTKVWSADELRPACEYILINASSPEVLARLLSIDYVELSLRSAKRPYLTQSDIVEAYSEKLFAETPTTLRTPSINAVPPEVIGAKSATSAKPKRKARSVRVDRRSAKARIGTITCALTANDNLETLALNTLHHGDCLELMKAISDQSVDLVLCDPPYGTCGGTSRGGSNIDNPLDLDVLWAEYQRIIKPTGNILLFGSQPFTTDVINAAPKGWHKYNNIWRKNRPTGENHARNKPLKDYEDVMVFTPANVAHTRKPGKRNWGTTTLRATYNPWRAVEVEKVNSPRRNANAKYTRDVKGYQGRHRYMGLEACPRMVLEYAVEIRPAGGNPYRKPIPLLDDLIRMYSNAGDVVLDNCVGSGSTAVAAIGADRRWIAIEKDPDCFAEAQGRINAALGA